MRLLFVVDGRSPIALNWITYFVDQGHEVHMVSTYPSQPDLKLASLEIVPVALSEAAGSKPSGKSGGVGGLLRKFFPVETRTAMRQMLGPMTLPRAAGQLVAVESRVRPDLVHAMRIPYEGMLAAQAKRIHNVPPLLVSIWGNDFTLHATSSPLMGELTRRALDLADALHADCRRDIRLAQEWGFPAERPTVVLPGGGGIQLDVFYPPDEEPLQPVVVQPRGFRAYVTNEAFFQAIPLVLKKHPAARFLCPGMEIEAQARLWIQELGIESNVELLPFLPRAEMADLFRRAQVMVSPSTHDGTPNTLLEALACGCFPVAGDIESLREWITPGDNGLLANPNSPQALAEAISQALNDAGLRDRARPINLHQVQERAEYGRSMAAAEAFYQELVEKRASY